jgi:hypothetical protein
MGPRCKHPLERIAANTTTEYHSVRMTTFHRTIWISALVLLLDSAVACGTSFNDGHVHDISTYITMVTVNSRSDGAATTVNVVSGASVSFMYSYDSSIVNITGGIISHIDAYNQAVTNVSGGTTAHLRVRDASTASVSGGAISQLWAYDAATISVYDISGEQAGALGSSSSNGNVAAPTPAALNIYGGTFSATTSRALGVVNIYGGYVGGVYSFNQGVTNVYGGKGVNAASLDVDGITNIYGGSLDEVCASSWGTTNVFGGDIRKFALGDFVYGHTGGILNVYGQQLSLSDGYLNGVLADGTAVHAPVVLSSTGKLNLILVPEPSTLALLGIGAIGLLLFTWRRITDSVKGGAR